MPNDTIKKIAQYKTRLAALEKELYAELAKLPARYGFADTDELIGALRRAGSSRPGRKTRGVKAARAAKAGRKMRVKITPDIEAKVKALAAEDKTGAEIAKATGISLPSVQNIKKKLGLVKARSKG